MDGLRTLIDLDGWMWMLLRREPTAGEHPTIIGYQHDLPAPVLAAVGAAIYDRAMPLHVYARLEALPARSTPLLVTRQELVDDDAYRAHPATVRYPALARLERSLFAVLPIGELGLLHLVSMHRMRRDALTFGVRERSLVTAILRELSWLHRLGVGEAQRAIAERISELTLRQKLVLFLVTEGFDVRRVATYLNVSVHTVNDHLKTIHRHFQVSSRPELLACLSGRAAPRQAWSYEMTRS
jgi:DNA-binding CsgD family transcriptional regulator